MRTPRRVLVTILFGPTWPPANATSAQRWGPRVHACDRRQPTESSAGPLSRVRRGRPAPDENEAPRRRVTPVDRKHVGGAATRGLGRFGRRTGTRDGIDPHRCPRVGVGQPIPWQPRRVLASMSFAGRQPSRTMNIAKDLPADVRELVLGEAVPWLETQDALPYLLMRRHMVGPTQSGDRHTPRSQWPSFKHVGGWSLTPTVSSWWAPSLVGMMRGVGQFHTGRSIRSCGWPPP